MLVLRELGELIQLLQMWKEFVSINILPEVQPPLECALNPESLCTPKPLLSHRPHCFHLQGSWNHGIQNGLNSLGHLSLSTLLHRHRQVKLLALV